MSAGTWIAVASLVGSLLGSGIVAGIFFGGISATVKAHGKWLEEHETKLDAHAREITEVRTEVRSKLSFLR